MLVLVCEVLSFVCLWELDRVALRTRAWLPVIAAQLTGNAAGRILPGGGATATVAAASMLRQAGIDTGDAAAAFTASTLLQLATTFALPVLVLPAIVGGAPVNHSLATAAYLGAVVFVLLLVTGSVVLGTDRPLELVGRAGDATTISPVSRLSSIVSSIVVRPARSRTNRRSCLRHEKVDPGCLSKRQLRVPLRDRVVVRPRARPALGSVLDGALVVGGWSA